MDNNSIIIEMIDRSKKDSVFRDQINGAKTETKMFVNAVLKTFEIMNLKLRKISRSERLNDISTAPLKRISRNKTKRALA